VDLAPSSAQVQITDGVRRLLSGHWTAPAHAAVGDATSSALWRAAVDQGWLGLDLAEAQGGAGLGVVDQTLVFRELGRRLVWLPLLGTLITIHAAAAAGRHGLVDRLLGGQTSVALAEFTSTYAVLDEVGALESRPAFSFDGSNHGCVVEVGQERTRVFDAAEVRWEARRKASFDAGVDWAHCELGDPSFVVEAADFDGYRYGSLLVSAMLSGIAEAVRDASVAYAKQRTQFGVPIGSFQAVKHRCADSALRAEAATQLVSLAALSADARSANWEALVDSARLVSATYAERSAADNIQNHGAMGYTAELDAHQYLKRTHTLRYVLAPMPDLGAGTAEAVTSAGPAGDLASPTATEAQQ
jgi:alkylation response protein AidB-like acyl-CoA dehydrogenase